MSNCLKLKCMATVLMLFTGCKGDDPEPVQETWQMTYDDYRSNLLDLSESEKQEYINFSSDVTVLRNGDEISIKGLFTEYPDAWIKGTISGNKVYIGNTQAIATDNGETVYFHWGYADYVYTNKHIEFEGIRFYLSTGPLFTISDNGNTMTNSEDPKYVAIWYNTVKDGYFYLKDEGTGLPDADIKVNIALHKVSGNPSAKAN